MENMILGTIAQTAPLLSSSPSCPANSQRNRLSVRPGLRSQGKLSHLRVNRRTGKHNLLATHLPPHLDFGSNSIDSTATEVSTATTATTSTWKTPRRQDRAPSQSPGFSLGSLALDDRQSRVSSTAVGQAQRNTRRRGAF
jgi:hypothetical protein